MENYRKRYISKLLSEAGDLIQEHDDISIANIMATVFRPKNMKGDNKDPYFMTDEEFSSALESTIEGLKEMKNDK